MIAALKNPYPGLTPFEERDAARFFGRDKEIDDILDRLGSRRLLATIGVSGCGKSSLVCAGVVPVLRMGAAENLLGPWQIHTITPGNAPLDALRTELQAADEWPSTSFDLIEYSRSKLKPGEKLLLIVDQFEELFRFRAESVEKDGGNAAALFVNLLLTAVDQREIPIYVLLTMRTDFLGECAQFRGLPEALNDCYYLVPRMTRLQQQEAIESPLQKQDACMTPALVQRLLNDSAEDPDHLPVLQHLLKRLWESWCEGGKPHPIGQDDYEAVGGWKNAIDADAEKILTWFPSEVDNVRRLFQWVTERGNGEKPVRRPRPLAECIEPSGLSRERLQAIVGAFQDRGLLRQSDLSDRSLVDLPHESVMWQWSRLKRWISEEAEYAAQLRFLLRSARQQVPLTGLALESALQLSSQRPSRSRIGTRYLSESELKHIDDWIDKSQQFEENKLNAAEARELSAWAAVSSRDDPERSLILGFYAWGKQRAMVPGLEQFLHEALLQSQASVTLAGHEGPVFKVAWSPDGGKLATASADHTVVIWEAKTGRELFRLVGDGDDVSSLDWSPDGGKLASAAGDFKVLVWDATTGSGLLALNGHSDFVSCVAWSPDGGKLASGSRDRTAKVWDAKTGQEILAITGHKSSVVGVAWSPDSTKLATASLDMTGKVWEASTGRELVSLGHRRELYDVAWSPDGSKLATASADKTARLWEADTGRELLALTGHQGYVYGLAWSPDGGKLATASGDSRAKVWDARTGRELLTLRGHQGYVWAVMWSPAGDKVATASDDRTAKVWDTGPGSEVLTITGHNNQIYCVGWSFDGSQLVTGSGDSTAKVWDVGSGRELLTLSGHEGKIYGAAWSPDAKKIATASEDQTAKVWDAAIGVLLLTVGGHGDKVYGIAWSPDGNKIATACGDRIARVFDAVTGTETIALRGHRQIVSGVAWSPDGRRLATASSDQTAMIWDASTGRRLRVLEGHRDSILTVEWSPDGTMLATSSGDKTAKVWSADTGHELLMLSGHQGFIWGITWSSDGTKLATASSDGTVKTWASASGRELLTLGGHQSYVFCVAWSPDGKRLAAGGDGMVQVYAVDVIELLKVVQSRITRPLTQDECRRYLSSDTCPALPRLA